MALLAGLAFVSCNKDDDGGSNNCVTCEAEGISTEICESENGNVIIAGQETQINFDEYVEGLDCN